MSITRLGLLLAVVAGIASAQTLPPSAPKTCSVNQTYYSGSYLWACTATNTWTLLFGVANINNFHGTGSGGGTPAANLALAPATLSFPAQTVATPSNPETVTVTNNGTSFYAVTGLAVTGANASDFVATSACGTNIALGCTFSVVFTPTYPGGSTGPSWTETATATLQGSTNYSVALTGTGQVLNGGLIVTSSAPSVLINGTSTFTSNRSVNFTLAPGSIGTLTTIDTTHARYTAPASIPVQTAYFGCPTGPNDSVWNTPITSLNVDSRSVSWLSQVQSGQPYMDTNYPRNAITATTYPTIDRNTLYDGDLGQYPDFVGTLYGREAGQLSGNATDGNDHHTISVAVNAGGVAGACQWFETYGDLVPASAGLTRTDCGSTPCNAVSGSSYSPTSYVALTTGTNVPAVSDNYHTSIAEIRSGNIHHPMKITFPGGYAEAYPVYLWPANWSNGYAQGNGVPFGARLRLNLTRRAGRGAPAMNTYSQYVQNILNAWVNYGFIFTDNGTTARTTWDMDVYEDPAVQTAVSVATGAAIISDFDIVATGPDPGNPSNGNGLQLTPSSIEVNPINTASATGGSALPVGFAYVTATDSSPVSGTEYSSGIGVALRGVAIGILKQNLVAITSTASYTYQLSTWVTGTTNQSVSWSLISGPGSITAAGLYTIPATSSVGTPVDCLGNVLTAGAASCVVLQASAAADSNATLPVWIELLSTSSDGNFRMFFNSTSIQTASLADGNGFSWWPQYGLDTGSLSGNFDGGVHATGVENFIYKGNAFPYGSSGDMHLHWILPNGNYKVRMMQAKDCWGPCTTFSGGPVYINVNGQMTSQNYLWGAAVGWLAETPWDLFAPALVANKTFDWWEGTVSAFGSTAIESHPEISGIELIPDTSAPHLSIDSGTEGFNYTTGAALTPPLPVTTPTAQLGAVGWYMANSATWAVTSGGGSINSSGLYTAPATGLYTQTATVTATSTVNTTLSATAQLTIPGNGIATASFSLQSWAYANTYLGAASASKVFTLTNSGTIPMTVAIITSQGLNPADFTTTTTCGATLAVAGTCTITATFSPTAIGARQGWIQIGGNASINSQSVSLTGTGVQGNAIASISATSLAFASSPNGTASSPLTLTISNSSSAVGGIVGETFAITGTNGADFTQTNTCGATVAPGASCVVSFVFTPSIVGSETATFTYAFTNGNSPLSASLTGTGTASAATISFSPASAVFGTVEAFQSTNLPITVTDTGSGSLIVSGVTITGTDAGQFAQINNCSTVTAGHTCTILVFFSPTNSDTAARSATLNIADNVTGTPQTIALSGSDYYGVTFAFDETNAAGTVVAYAASPLNFGSIAVGSPSPSQGVVFANISSTNTVTITSLVVSGTNAADFTLTNNCGASIAPSASCSATITFTPSIVGVEHALILFTNSVEYSGYGPQIISLSGIGH